MCGLVGANWVREDTFALIKLYNDDAWRAVGGWMALVLLLLANCSTDTETPIRRGRPSLIIV